MNSCELSVSIAALANAIANNIKDEESLGLFAAAVSQLGDTLETILAHRALCHKLSTAYVSDTSSRD